MLFSVIVTTYNRPEALALVLEGLLAQEPLGPGAPDSYEVIVADDGSGPETRGVIDRMHPRFDAARLRLEQVWHPDEGFRAGAIRNRAAARSLGERLIFLDGDCIPGMRFIASHALAARCAGVGTRAGSRSPTMARGSRALLSERLTERVLREGLLVQRWTAREWLAARWRGDVNRLRGLVAGLASVRPRAGASADWRSVRTCNLAVWRDDFERVNGFDERFVGWGYEDSDLAIRLINAGVLVRRAGSAATVIHLWHRENDRRFEGENLARLQATERSRVIRAEVGLAEAQPPGSRA